MTQAGLPSPTGVRRAVAPAIPRSWPASSLDPHQEGGLKLNDDQLSPTGEPVLSPDQLERIHSWWRVANYLSVGQIRLGRLEGAGKSGRTRPPSRCREGDLDHEAGKTTAAA
jgi:hypothetical protein